MPTAPSDEQVWIPTRRSLLERLRKENSNADWQIFFDTYWRLIFDAARKAGLDEAAAQDVVQETVSNVLRNLAHFESRHQGALQAYLRQSVLNRMAGEARRVARHQPALELHDVHAAPGLSPLEQVIGVEALERYEQALARLPPHYREAIVMRIELQCSYQDVAVALGKANANSARSLVVRALYRLYEEMNGG